MYGSEPPAVAGGPGLPRRGPLKGGTPARYRGRFWPAPPYTDS